MKRKVCARCRLFYEGEECPICKGKQIVGVWRGRLFVNDPEKSEIAKKVGIKVKGEYALKVR